MGFISACWMLTPALLYLFWSLASGAAIIALLPLPFASSFRSAVYLSACRGKLWEERPTGALGSFTGLRVPQAWFSHFYDIGLLVNSAALYLATTLWGFPRGLLYLPLGLLQLHLLRRCLETHFMMSYPKHAYMHAIAYVFGLVYYTVLPLTCLPSKVYSIFLNDLPLKTGKVFEEDPNTELRLLDMLGAVVFLAGSALQHHSHRILANLSRNAQRRKISKESTEQYRIPRGGGFEMVSCPHYLAEIIIYLGLALLLDLRRPLSWLPLIWVIANLMLAAGPTHSWYKRKFENYPADRRALLPFLY